MWSHFLTALDKTCCEVSHLAALLPQTPCTVDKHALPFRCDVAPVVACLSYRVTGLHDLFITNASISRSCHCKRSGALTLLGSCQDSFWIVKLTCVTCVESLCPGMPTG